MKTAASLGGRNVTLHYVERFPHGEKRRFESPLGSAKINNFDIPLGVVRQTMEGQAIAEFTAWTSASDLKNLRWHFRTYRDQSIRSVDLRAALTAANGKVRTISMDSQQPVIDLSTHFR